MKKFYLPFKKAFIALAFILMANITAKSQVLAAGDIAFTGYIANATGTESFSFVLLVNIPSGTVLNFTDNGWNGTALAATEQTCTWTAGSALVAGREISIAGTSAGAATATVSGSSISAGTVTGSLPSFATSGDQLLAYQGTAASPTFISAIHMNVYSTDLGQCGNTTAATWDPVCIAANANSCIKPPSLTTGTNAVWIGTEGVGASEQDNAVFNCTGPLATPAQVRAAVNNSANWTVSSIAPPTLTVPSGCAFLASIFPSRLLSFTARNMASHIALNWQTDNEQDMVGYEVERSFDGRQFSNIKTVAARRGSLVNDYVYNDADAFRSSNNTVYYRIKFIDVAGEIFYSDIKSVKLNKEGSLFVHNLPNPFTGTLQFNIVSKNSETAIIRISDMAGRILVSETRKLNAGDNRISLSQTGALSSGIYTMEILPGNNEKKSFKLVKNPQ
jgi:Secretion system C-terminal sorting domain